jgi:hypothetical protein
MLCKDGEKRGNSKMSKNLNSRNLNGDLDAKLASCIPGLKFVFSEKKLFFIFPIGIYIKQSVADGA